MRITTQFFVSFLAVAMCLSGGASEGEKVAESLETWFDVKTEFAKQLDSAAGGKRWHYRPVQGVDHEVGTLLIGSAPAQTCQFELTKPQTFSALPKLTSSRNVEAFADAPIPEEWTKSLVAGGNFKAGDKLTLEYTGLQVTYVDENSLYKSILECLDGTYGVIDQDITLIRGKVTGKYSAKYGKPVKGSANLKVSDNKLVQFKYDERDGFEFQDDTIRGQFQIISVLRLQLLDRNAAGDALRPIMIQVEKVVEDENAAYISEMSRSETIIHNMQNLGSVDYSKEINTILRNKNMPYIAKCAEKDMATEPNEYALNLAFGPSVIKVYHLIEKD